VAGRTGRSEPVAVAAAAGAGRDEARDDSPPGVRSAGGADGAVLHGAGRLPADGAAAGDGGVAGDGARTGAGDDGGPDGAAGAAARAGEVSGTWARNRCPLSA